MTFEEPRRLLVRAQGEPSPLYEREHAGAWDEADAFTRNVQMDDFRLDLPEDLANALRSWSLARPPKGFSSCPDLRKHVKEGLAAERRNLSRAISSRAHQRCHGRCGCGLHRKKVDGWLVRLPRCGPALVVFEVATGSSMAGR
ncbi:hypothetical protein [Streptomyces sp. AGS-58]|uniref:hypothetical protein n=1 Tax=unclassified Streptomyces TaxID=2593676 RepID=UPI0035A29100